MTIRIVQITPEIGPGTGVGAVAHHLEQAWRDQGIEVSRFTLEEARGAWIPMPSGGASGKLALIGRVVWFSTVGTVLARRHLRREPDLLSVCHNDALAGDVYVNHGLIQVAMRARGSYRLRMARNPLHLFSTMRDRRRYRSTNVHSRVVNLVEEEDRLIRTVFPRIGVPTTVVPNGVDTERFAPADEETRSQARQALGRSPADRLVLFIGNEFGRKGLNQLIDAMGLLDELHHLVVVGGSPDLIQSEQAALSDTLKARVHFVGPHPDPRPWLRAADVLATPSAYESFGLVVLEALASGVPVVGTATGCVPDVIVEGRNGAIVESDPAAIAAGIERTLSQPREQLARHARLSAEPYDWARIANRYLDVLVEAHALRSVEGAS